MNRNCPVKWIMQHPVVSVDEHSKLSEIIRLFNVHGFNHLPVTNENKLSGIISKEDVLFNLLNFWKTHSSSEKEKYENTQALELMSTKPVHIYESQAVDLAVEILLQGAFHILPVVNQDDEIVGMVSAADLLKVYYQESA